MSSGGVPDMAMSRTNSQVQDRIRSSVVDLALGRTPNSSGIRQGLLQEMITPAVSVLKTSGQRTDVPFSFSSSHAGLDLDSGLGNLATVKEKGSEDGGDEDRDGGYLVQDLIDRLRAVEAQIVNQHATPGVIGSVLPNVHSDYHHFQPDSLV
jgi:hypothetical protein